MPEYLDDAFTTHHGHMPEITILSPTEAEGIWAMFDYVLKPGQPTGIKDTATTTRRTANARTANGGSVRSATRA